MIRRPPTIISLGDEELQYHLHRIFLRTLSMDFDHLHLEDQHDQDQGHQGDTQPDLSLPAPLHLPTDQRRIWIPIQIVRSPAGHLAEEIIVLCQASSSWPRQNHWKNLLLCSRRVGPPNSGHQQCPHHTSDWFLSFYILPRTGSSTAAPKSNLGHFAARSS